MADAHFNIGGETVDVFGPRGEQVAHLLELAQNRRALELAQRIGSHVADGEPGEDILELDQGEQHELLDALEKVVAASKSAPQDLLDLRAAIKESRCTG